LPADGFVGGHLSVVSCLFIVTGQLF